MRFTQTATEFFGSALRDMIAGRVYPRYSRCKTALLPHRDGVQAASREGIRFREQAVGWNNARRLEWMLKRLRLVVRRAYLDTQYYRDVYDRAGFDPFVDFGFEDFARLPILEKDEILGQASRLISGAISHDRLRKDSTGGSTGIPVEVWLGPEERGWRQSASEWLFSHLGLPVGSRTAYLWGHHLDPRDRTSIKDRAYFFFNNAEWFDCFRLEPRLLEQYHQRLEKFRPACIIAYANALGALADYVLESSYRPGYPTRFILTGAEKLRSEHRQWAEAAFSCPVFERYGSRDVGMIGFQSAPTARELEIDWANILVEPEHEGAEAPILITKLHADGMPMIRYRIGDVGLFGPSARPGHPTLVLDEVVGRELERIWLPDGSWLQGTIAPHLLKDYPVKEYMVVQSEDYSVELQIIPRRGFGERDRLDIARLLSSNLKGLKVSAVLVEQLPRTRSNKLRPVISHVTGSGSHGSYAI